MSPTDHVPSYRRHKQSGQAIVALPDGLGTRRDLLLGKYGSAESRAEYARVLAEWEANGRRLPQVAAAADLTVNELILAFWKHAEGHYRRPDGTPTDEIFCLRSAVRPLRALYGHTSVRDFGPLALGAALGLASESPPVKDRLGRVAGIAERSLELAECSPGSPPCRYAPRLAASLSLGDGAWFDGTGPSPLMQTAVNSAGGLRF